MKKICLFLLLTASLTSCVKDVILDAKEDPFLAVYCILKVDSVQELKLSYTKGASMSEAPRVTEANPVLTDLTEGREAGRFIQVNDSLWRLHYSAIPTHRYRLEITVPGREPVWAEQTMPAEPPVEVMDINNLTVQEVPWLGTLDAKSLFPYLEGATIGEITISGLCYRFTFPCTTWIYAENYDTETAQYVPVEELCTDYPHVDDFNLTGHIWGRVEEENFDTSLMMAYAHRTCLSGYSLHRDFLRFSKEEEQTQCYFTLSGAIEQFGKVYFAALSDDYDLYLCDAYQQYYAEQSRDLSSIYLRDNLYSNIHGGIGIFGSTTVIPMLWDNLKATILVYGPGFDPGDDFIP